jgi:hypothetical protein
MNSEECVKTAPDRIVGSVRSRLVSRSFLLVTLLLSWFPAHAVSPDPSVLTTATADLNPVADAGVQQNTSSGNFGGLPSLPVGYRLDHGRLEGYLRFDLSSLPGDATIDSATLKLFASEGGGTGAIKIRRITSAWGEYTVNWTNRPSYLKDVEASTDVPTSGWAEWDVTGLVQGWWQGTIDNHGLALTGPTGGENWSSFNSRESGSNKPILSILFTTPAPTAELAPPPGETKIPPTLAPVPTSELAPPPEETKTPPLPPAVTVEPISAYIEQWVFRGGVYDSWSAHWLGGVVVDLWWQDPTTLVWTLIVSGSTDLAGQYELVAEVAEGGQFRIQLDPGHSPALVATVATSASGGVSLDAEIIQFANPLPGEYNGNNFHLWREGVSLTGADDDDDGLPNDVENGICTDPQNPDSDHDVLLDGWEVLGQSFSDGTLLDLPGMGAHPCRPDVFVEIDWVASTPPLAEAMQTLSNVFWDHGIGLHIDTGQWGGGGPVPNYSTCSGGAEGHEPPPGFPTLLSTRVDHSDPHRLWTFHYGVFREQGDYPNGDSMNSYACGGNNMILIVENTANSQMAALGHELGHGLGLSHAGRVGSRVQGRYGDLVYYTGTSKASGGNQKPNFHSIMNYSYNGRAFWNPSTDSRVFMFNYSEVALPSLNEEHLDERPDSPFALAVQSLPHPPGLLPVVRYSCLDPNNSDRVWIVYNAGLQTVARRIYTFFKTTTNPTASPWEFPSVSWHPPGIDWDCDRIIESDVAANINGNAGGNLIPAPSSSSWSNLHTSLEGSNEWPLLTFRTMCPSDMTGEVNNFPPEYLSAADDPPCLDPDDLSSGSTDTNGPRSSADKVVDPEDFPPGESCDGVDNDDNGLVDEGCPDTDQDGVVDPLDNCPLVFNAEQADRNRDYIGDECQRPPGAPAGLSGAREGQAVRLVWLANAEANVVGYNLYRQIEGEAELRFLGSGWPLTTDTTFIDTDLGADTAASYAVAAVNRYGYESAWTEPVTVGAVEPATEHAPEVEAEQTEDVPLESIAPVCLGLVVLGLIGLGTVILLGGLRARMS